MNYRLHCGKIILLVILWIFGGCSQKQPDQKPLKKISTLIVNNVPLSRHILIDPPSTAYENDILKVTLKVTNFSNQRYNDIIYRFRWYDQDGYVTADALSIWKPLYLESGDKKVITAVAPSPDAEQFKFYIKLQNGQSQVERIESQSLLNDTLCYGPEELHLFVEQMVSSMLRDKIFDGSPVIMIDTIKNKSDEFIDTTALTNTIQTLLIKSKRARFVDNKIRKIIAKELEYQANSKYVDQGTVVKRGRQIAPNYILSGEISAIKRKNDFFYKIVLKLYNLETGIVEWAEEKEIRKVGKNGE